MVLGLGNLLPTNKEDHHHHAPTAVGSGRGGAGNIHTTETTAHNPGPDAEEVAAERYAEAHRSQTTVHAGRGGAGNVGTLSTSSAEPQDRTGTEAHPLQQQHFKHEVQTPHLPAHSGRGGFGNLHPEALVHDGNHHAA